MANCILRGDAAAAYDCLRLKKARREDPIQILSQIQYTIVDLALASAYIREKRTAAEYAADMGQHEYRVGLYFRAAAGIDPAYFDTVLAACLDADIQLKSGVAGYIPLERLIAAAAR